MNDLGTVDVDELSDTGRSDPRPKGGKARPHDRNPSHFGRRWSPSFDLVSTLLKDANLILDNPILTGGRARKVPRVKDQYPHRLTRFFAQRRARGPDPGP